MIDLSSLNAFDYAVLLMLVISGVLATFRGITRELMGLAGWGVAFIASRLIHPLIFGQTENIIGNESLAHLLSFALPFVAVIIIWFFFSNVISPVLKDITFGKLDRFLGFFFGVIRGFVLIALVYIGALTLYDQESNLPVSVTDSLTIMPTRIIASGMVWLAPENLRNNMRGSIPKQDVGSIARKIFPSPSDVIEDGQDAIGNAGQAAGENLLPDEYNALPGVSQ